MEFLFIFIALFLIMGTAAAQAGYSMKFWGNKLQSWQKRIPLGNRVPELFIGLVFGSIALWGWDHAYGLVLKYVEAFPITTVITLFTGAGVFGVLLLFAAFVAFVGKESATVYYLSGNWDGYKTDSNNDGKVDFDDGRKSTMRPFNDFIAKALGIGLSSKWYPKIWAFTKGLLISIPIGLLCAPFMLITRHIGIRLGEFMRVKFNHHLNFYAEFVGDGLAYAGGLTLFIYLVTNVL